MERASNREKNGLPAFVYFAMILVSIVGFSRFFFTNNFHPCVRTYSRKAQHWLETRLNVFVL